MSEGNTSSDVGTVFRSVQTHPQLYRIIGFGIPILLSIALGCVLYFFWKLNILSIFDLPGNIPVGVPLIIAMALYVYASFVEVDTNQIAGAYFLEIALVPLKPGPHFLWAGFMTARVEQSTMFSAQFPDIPEKVFKDSDDVKLPDGMKRPLRFVTKAEEKGSDVLSGRMTIVVTYIVQYKIRELFLFYTNYTVITEFLTLVEDIASGVLTDEIAERSPTDVIRDVKKISTILRDQLRIKLEPSGIDIANAWILSPDVGKTVSGALAQVNESVATAQATIKKASADAEAIRLKGQAEAEAALAMKNSLGIDGAQTAGLKAVEALASGNNNTVVAGVQGGLTDIFAAGAAFVKSAQNKGSMK